VEPRIELTARWRTRSGVGVMTKQSPPQAMGGRLGDVPDAAVATGWRMVVVSLLSCRSITCWTNLMSSSVSGVRCVYRALPQRRAWCQPFRPFNSLCGSRLSSNRTCRPTPSAHLLISRLSVGPQGCTHYGQGSAAGCGCSSLFSVFARSPLDPSTSRSHQDQLTPSPSTHCYELATRKKRVVSLYYESNEYVGYVSLDKLHHHSLCQCALRREYNRWMLINLALMSIQL
jgi:hypothetical protein